MGSNIKGQLGLGRRDYKLRSSPSLIESISNMEISQICTGSYQSYAICQNKDVYAWGNGEYGQLGLGDYSNTYVPTRIILSSKYLSQLEIVKIDSGPRHTMMLTKQRTVYCCGDNSYGQLGIPSKSRSNHPTLCRYLKEDIIDIACGTKHTLFLTGKK